MRIEQKLDTPVNFRINRAFATVELLFVDKVGGRVSVVLDIESACVLSSIMDNGPAIPRSAKKPWWRFLK